MGLKKDTQLGMQPMKSTLNTSTSNNYSNSSPRNLHQENQNKIFMPSVNNVDPVVHNNAQQNFSKNKGQMLYNSSIQVEEEISKSPAQSGDNQVEYPPRPRRRITLEEYRKRHSFSTIKDAESIKNEDSKGIRKDKNHLYDVIKNPQSKVVTTQEMMDSIIAHVQNKTANFKWRREDDEIPNNFAKKIRLGNNSIQKG